MQNLITKNQKLLERMNTLETKIPKMILDVYLKKYNTKNKENLIRDLNTFQKKQIVCDNKFKDFLTQKYDTNYEERFILTETEKDFILLLLSKCNIDLSESQKYKLIDLLAQHLIRPLQNDYIERLVRQKDQFNLKKWENFSNNKDFLEFITDIHKLKDGEKEIATYAYARCGDVMNFLELISYAKNKIPKLQPYYYKIIKQTIKYATKNGDCYPLNLKYGTKSYIAEYIMTEEKISKEMKQFALFNDETADLSIAILASKNFTEEEKEIIIKRHMFYQEKKKEERKYYETPLEELLNRLYYNKIFDMRKYLKDEYESINTDKLLRLSTEELYIKLNEVIDENKLPYKYFPYYYNHFTEEFYFSKSEINPKSLKENYINNLNQMIHFLQQASQKYQIIITSGIIDTTDSYNFANRNNKQTGQEDIFKKKENLLEKRKIISFRNRHRKTNLI